MASRSLGLADRVSAAGWRFLLGLVLLALFAQSIAARHYAVAFVLAAALGLVAFDLWRLLPRRAPAMVEPAGERRAAQRHDRALALLDAVTVALFALDPNGRIRFANRAGRALAGFEVARLQDIPALGEAGAATILALPVGGRQLLTLADGRSMLVWVGALAAPGDGPQRLVSMQAVAGELDAVQVGAWHRMARVLAHEMMNSLTPIASLAESLTRLADESALPPAMARAVATIDRRSRHLMHFVERYRAIVDLPEPELADVDLSAFLADIETLAGVELRARGIDFVVDPVEPGLQVAADRALLEQAVLNLVKNARQAVADQAEPRVELSCTGNGDKVTISVRDNGGGIKEDQLEEIFVPFFSTKSGGAGIGLTLARQIAAAHGGQLNVKRFDSEGAAFGLTLSRGSRGG